MHRAASEELPASLPAMPLYFDEGDGWATEELRYDAALRPVFHRVEGIGVATTASYDGLGLRTVVGPQQSSLIEVDPPARRRTVTRTVALEDGAAVIPAGGTAGAKSVREIASFDGRGLLVERSATDVADGVERITSYAYDELGQLAFSLDPAGRAVESTYDAAGRTVRVRESGAGGRDRADLLPEFRSG